MTVMIGVDPHKGSHTVVAIGPAEEPLGQLRVRACGAQAEKLVAWAAAWPERTWAVEGAGGLGASAGPAADRCRGAAAGGW
jgi:transposase